MAENVLDRMKRIDEKKKITDFMVKEKQPYEFKVKYATIRAREFVSECDSRGLNYHVSVGGLDSITLFMFLRSKCCTDPITGEKYGWSRVLDYIGVEY